MNTATSSIGITAASNNELAAVLAAKIYRGTMGSYGTFGGGPFVGQPNWHNNLAIAFDAAFNAVLASLVADPANAPKATVCAEAASEVFQFAVAFIGQPNWQAEIANRYNDAFNSISSKY